MQLNHELKQAFIERLTAGLTRRAVTKPSKWAETYRYVKTQKWSFREYPWLRDMHDSNNPYNVGQKAAQMGFTETLLNLTFYTVDMLGKDVLYVLPNKKPDASNFSSGRFDPALEQSPHIANMFNKVNNVDHKRAGVANLYIEGSHSRSGLKSKPCYAIYMDEVAEFVEENIPLAFERVSGQKDFQIWLVSTPTFENAGISKYYEMSDKKLFYFKCPLCNRMEYLRFPESLIIVGENRNDPRVNESHLICTQCKAVLPHETKPDWLSRYEWVPQHAQRQYAGWSISQLYSPTVKPSSIALSYFDSLDHPAHEVELYNSKLGLTHVTKGARIEHEDIEIAISTGPKRRRNDPVVDGLYTMGVDVGKYLHFVIRRWVKNNKNKHSFDLHLSLKPIVEHYGKVEHFYDLDAFMRQYNIASCVVDKNPETRAALEFANKHYGKVKLCYFSRGVNSRNIVTNRDINEPSIAVDRSSWFDLSLGRYKNRTIYLPVDVNLEFRQHLQAPIKTYKKDENGNFVTRYVTEGALQDHYALADIYSEIALAFAGLNESPQDIK